MPFVVSGQHTPPAKGHFMLVARLCLTLATLFVTSQTSAFNGEILAPPAKEIALSPARYTYALGTESFLVFLGDASLLSKIKMSTTGNAFFVKNSQPYAWDDLQRTNRLEDLTVLPDKMNISRWEKKSGIVTQFMSGSALSNDYYELIETRSKKIIFDWQAPENFDDFYEIEYKFGYSNITKSWSMSPTAPYRYDARYNTIYNARPIINVTETEDALNVAITKMVDVDTLMKNNAGTIIKRDNKVFVKLTFPLLSVADTKLATMTLYIYAGRKSHGFTFSGEDALIREGYMTREGDSLIIPLEALQRLDNKLTTQRITTGRVTLTGSATVSLSGSTVPTANFNSTFQN